MVDRQRDHFASNDGSRAMERAGALLRYFDADADGLLSFEEFRG